MQFDRHRDPRPGHHRNSIGTIRRRLNRTGYAAVVDYGGLLHRIAIQGNRSLDGVGIKIEIDARAVWRQRLNDGRRRDESVLFRAQDQFGSPPLGKYPRDRICAIGRGENRPVKYRAFYGSAVGDPHVRHGSSIQTHGAA